MLLQFSALSSYHHSPVMLCVVFVAVQIHDIHCESKKLCHFYFYCNFGKCWSIFKILSMSESERNGSWHSFFVDSQCIRGILAKPSICCGYLTLQLSLCFFSVSVALLPAWSKIILTIVDKLINVLRLTNCSGHQN